jgi:ribonucleoside-diphosphate reductase alpha chain
LGGLSENIFKLRYAFTKKEDFPTACGRTAHAIASAEVDKNGKLAQITKEYEGILSSRDFIPGGRTLRNAGRAMGMLLNCFVLGVDDNMDSIGELFKNVMIVSSWGGGVGVDFSNVRPPGDVLKTKSGNASGAVSFMIALNAVGEVIKIGGSRRIALMGLMRCDHPEILNFISSKTEEGKLEYFNISVGITDAFIDAVKKNKNWQLKFGNKVYKTIKAKKLWDYIVKNAWNKGEPGIINLDNMHKYNNLYYCEPLSSTNPCGEVPLPVGGACCLGSINLSNMYDEAKNDVDWKKLKSTIRTSVRFLDNVLDVTHYPLQEIGLTVRQTRRIGLGTMGLHYLMLKLGIKDYGSSEALEFMDDLYSQFRNHAYMASVELAKEKGPFEKFKAEPFVKGQFVRTLPRRIRKQIEEFGIRNATVLSMPPTGTTSLLAGVSQGLEPLFHPRYKRRYYDTDKKGRHQTRETIEYDPLFSQFREEGRDTSHFLGGYEVSPEQHIEVQATVQQYVDSAISKTILIANKFPAKRLGEVLLKHIGDIKGTTIYREGSRGEEVLIPMPYK